MTSTCIGLGVMSKVISRVVDGAVDRARAGGDWGRGGAEVRRVIGGGVGSCGGR